MHIVSISQKLATRIDFFSMSHSVNSEPFFKPLQTCKHLVQGEKVKQSVNAC